MSPSVEVVNLPSSRRSTKLTARGRAQASIRERLWLRRDLGLIGDMAQCLDALVEDARTVNRTEIAARPFGAATGMRLRAGVVAGVAGRVLGEQAVTATRSTRGEAAFAPRWAEGEAMEVDQAIAYALAATDDLDGVS